MSKKSKIVKPTKSDNSTETKSRRKFLGEAGLVAGAMILPQRPPGNPAGPMNQETQPLNTPVEQLLKLNRNQAGQLTPGARSLTKADLVALGRGDISQSAKLRNLKMEDLKSLTDVMSGLAGPAAQVRAREGGPGITINCCTTSTARTDASAAKGFFCCCCCCCCCAVAMTPSQAIV